jgi:hypothetical protein
MEEIAATFWDRREAVVVWNTFPLVLRVNVGAETDETSSRHRQL